MTPQNFDRAVRGVIRFRDGWASRGDLTRIRTLYGEGPAREQYALLVQLAGLVDPPAPQVSWW